MPDMVSAQDYYPFGMLMPGRSLSSDKFRFGFNGKQNDNEVAGIGNWQDYGLRMYNPRLARFPSVDPLTASYPELTPYQFASLNPIWCIDLDGAEGIVASPLGDQNVISPVTARYVAHAIYMKHAEGLYWWNSAENARQQAIANGDPNGGGIGLYKKCLVYLSPWWQTLAPMSDANDGAVFMSGKNLDGSKANATDYVMAGVGFFIPFVSGSAIKNVLRGYRMDIKGYKYGKEIFRTAEEFERALTKIGNQAEKKSMIQSVLRDVAKTNEWKKAGDISKKTGREFYDMGNGVFGSIDETHGHFEIFTKEGKNLKHQGSINVDGFQNKARNVQYDLKL